MTLGALQCGPALAAVVALGLLSAQDAPVVAQPARCGAPVVEPLAAGYTQALPDSRKVGCGRDVAQPGSAPEWGSVCAQQLDWRKRLLTGGPD